MRFLVLAGLLGGLACGGTSGKPSPPRPTDATDATDATPPARPRALERADCARLLDHYLAVELAELRAALPADQVPTDEQVAKIRQRFADEGMAGCVGAARPPFDCAMAATTSQAIKTCLAPSPVDSSPNRP